MQIDILSQNTLKLTLSRLDMFDLDIKYESLSGKNPETKRLLSHVLKSIQLDKRVGFDFSGERLFVEAFPRPDGGCMLYISSLENESFTGKQRRTAPEREWLDTESIFREKRQSSYSIKAAQKAKGGSYPYYRIYETDSLSCLKGVCKSLCWLRDNNRLDFDTSLYNNNKVYRLVIECGNIKPVSAVIQEFGSILDCELELANTVEHFQKIKSGKAAEALAKCL